MAWIDERGIVQSSPTVYTTPMEVIVGLHRLLEEMDLDEIRAKIPEKFEGYYIELLSLDAQQRLMLDLICPRAIDLTMEIIQKAKLNG